MVVTDSTAHEPQSLAFLTCSHSGLLCFDKLLCNFTSDWYACCCDNARLRAGVDVVLAVHRIYRPCRQVGCYVAVIAKLFENIRQMHSMLECSWAVLGCELLHTTPTMHFVTAADLSCECRRTTTSTMHGGTPRSL